MSRFELFSTDPLTIFSALVELITLLRGANSLKRSASGELSVNCLKKESPKCKFAVYPSVTSSSYMYK